MIQLLHKQVKELPGYKIRKSHFRIGSKIHISDFFYAKRFFQNHFFASRFAFVLAKEIRKFIDTELLKKINNEGVTLIGYGIYSELLVSLLEKFLRAAGPKGIKKINHNMVDDMQNLQFIKKKIKPYNNCLIIVPIASTFSTSVKIEEALVKSNDRIRFQWPHYNLLYIAHKEETTTLDPIEEEFGWINKDISLREILMTAYYDEGKVTERTQKYFVCLPSFWQTIERCLDCFPRKGAFELLLDEKPLFDTDRTSVTPTSIFDFPIGRQIDPIDSKREFTLTPAMLTYGHHKKNDSHFFYRIDTELFLEVNQNRVTQWLKQLKKRKEVSFNDSDHLLIISSCHYSNTALLNLVNEVLFTSAANIIHFDPDQDYIQNFELIYGAEICAADKIIFVDDSLKTAKTLTKIEEFVKYSLSRKSERTSHVLTGNAKGISECIFLINKAQHFTLYSLSGLDKDLVRIFAFANLHLFTSLTYEENAPLVMEMKRYKLLQEQSYLDSLQIHFFRQAAKLEVNNESSDDQVKTERHLAMLEATHRLYQFFTNTKEYLDALSTFEEFSKMFHEKTQVPFVFSYQHESSGSKFSMRDACLLKVLTQSPFTQFEPLRRMVFKWILQLLDGHVNDIITLISRPKGGIEYHHFEDLKFLIRRAGLMNSNYLISFKMLDMLNSLYDGNGFGKIMEGVEDEFEREMNADKTKVPIAKTKGDRKKKKNSGKELFDDKTQLEVIKNRKINALNEFHVFYTAQVKELLLQNETRSTYLENLLKSVTINCPRYLQVVRILRSENAIIIQKFYDFAKDRKEWVEMYRHEDTAKDIDDSVEPIRKFLSNNNIRSHQRFKFLEQFSKMTEQGTLPENVAFLNYLWLKYFLEHDKGMDHSLTTKTEYIFQKLVVMLQYTGRKQHISGIGSFLVIRDSQQRSYLIYNKNALGVPQLDVNRWNNTEDRFLEEFLKGNYGEPQRYKKSVTELIRNESGLWEDLYATNEKVIVDGLSKHFLPERFNRIILLRLSKRLTDETEEVQGLVGLYFTVEPAELTEGVTQELRHEPYYSFIQYLITLKSSLSDFVEKHHQNNEFGDWLVSENSRKLALLAGHGKYTLQKIAARGLPFLNIVLNLEHLQVIIILNESTKAKVNEKAFGEIKDTFNKFYNAGKYDIIEKEYFDRVVKMATNIYSFEEIEQPIKIRPYLNPIPEDFSFYYNESILDIIFFELFFNAKKNRWLFLPGEDAGGLTENTLDINITTPVIKGKRVLQIAVTNTTPGLLDEHEDFLNHINKNIKNEDATSGTALLKRLVRDIMDGTIHFSCDPQNEDTEQGIHLFTVTIILYPIDDKK